MKKEKTGQRFQELDRMGVLSSPQKIIRRKEAGPEYLSYDPEAIWQEHVVDRERAIIERVDRALASGAELGEGPEVTPFERNLLKAFDKILKGGEKTEGETGVKDERNLKKQ